MRSTATWLQPDRWTAPPHAAGANHRLGDRRDAPDDHRDRLDVALVSAFDWFGSGPVAIDSGSTEDASRAGRPVAPGTKSASSRGRTRSRSGDVLYPPVHDLSASVPFLGSSARGCGRSSRRCSLAGVVWSASPGPMGLGVHRGLHRLALLAGEVRLRQSRHRGRPPPSRSGPSGGGRPPWPCSNRPSSRSLSSGCGTGDGRLVILVLGLLSLPFLADTSRLLSADPPVTRSRTRSTGAADPFVPSSRNSRCWRSRSSPGSAGREGRAGSRIGPSAKSFVPVGTMRDPVLRCTGRAYPVAAVRARPPRPGGAHLAFPGPGLPRFLLLRGRRAGPPRAARASTSTSSGSSPRSAARSRPSRPCRSPRTPTGCRSPRSSRSRSWRSSATWPGRRPLPFALIGAIAAPLTWAIARDAGARPFVAVGAGVLVAIPLLSAAIMAQPDNFSLYQPLVHRVALDGRARAPRLGPSGLSFVLAGPARRAGDARPQRRPARPGRARPRLPVRPLAGVALGRCPPPGHPVRGGGRRAWRSSSLVMAPWWARQLVVFGSLSPSTTSGKVLFIRDIGEWNSITTPATLDHLLGMGIGPLIMSRIGGAGRRGDDLRDPGLRLRPRARP